MHCSIFFFFNDTATTEIYTLSLHDALPISAPGRTRRWQRAGHPILLRCARSRRRAPEQDWIDRKSTRLNSSHGYISYAVFCLKKKKNNKKHCRSPIEAVDDRPSLRTHSSAT